MKYYDVFSAGAGGGKRFAIVEESLPESVMAEIAASSNAPLTGFILHGKRASPTEVRFFNQQGKEKLESDSGALVVAHHVGGEHVTMSIPVAITEAITVAMRGGDLQVTLEDDACWTIQGDHHILPLRGSEAAWLEVLGISRTDLEPGMTLMCSGQLEKHNLIVPIQARVLDTIQPNFERLAELLETFEINGVIVAAFISKRANLDFRFFAPHKGLFEDNAGSYSLASLCGYQAAHTPSGIYDLIVAQGYGMGRPSSLRTRFIARDGMALAVRVGGTVREVEGIL